MKKIIILLLCICLFVSCSQKKECIWCGEEKERTVRMELFEEADEDEEDKEYKEINVCRQCRSEIISMLLRDTQESEE